MPDLNLTLVWNFATALLTGALFGALSGWLALVLDSPWVLAAGMLAAAGVVVAGYVLSVRLSPDSLALTTEIAAMATFLLGALAAHGQRELTVGLGVVIAALLACKQPLHGFVSMPGTTQLRSSILFATMGILAAGVGAIRFT